MELQRLADADPNLGAMESQTWQDSTGCLSASIFLEKDGNPSAEMDVPGARAWPETVAVTIPALSRLPGEQHTAQA